MFPDRIFVSREGEGEDGYWNAEADPDKLLGDNGIVRVATYQLVEVNEGAKIPSWQSASNTDLAVE